MKTTGTLTLLLVLVLLLGACTIQPAVAPADNAGAGDAAATTAAEPTVETDVEATTDVDATTVVTETGENTAGEDTTTDAAGAATVTGATTLTDDAVVTTTTSVLTTTVTTVTEGAVVSETAVTTGTDATGADAGADASLLPTPTAAPVAAAGGVTDTGVVTAGAALTATTVVTDANAGTILQVINSTPGLESLATALTASGMATALDVPGPVTFFAPNNDAFAAIPADQMNALLADPATLAPILQYHIIIDNVSAAGLGTLGAALSSSGLPITVTVQADGPLLINDAAVVQGDIPAANGVIHIINGLLLPPATTAP